MKIVKPPLSIRIIYWITNIAIGLMTVVFVFALVFTVLLYTDFFGDDLQLHTDFPVQVDFIEEGTLTINSLESKVKFVEAIPRIHFINTPTYIVRRVFGIIVLFIVLVTYFLWIFRKFIVNVKKGLVFSIENINYLKKLAYIIAGFWLFTIVYARLFYYYIAKNVSFENAVVSSEIPNKIGILFIALFIWVLAHIFETGLKLQEENELTI